MDFFNLQDVDISDVKLINTKDIDIVAYFLEMGRKNKKLRKQEELRNQWEDNKNKIVDRDFVMNNKIGKLAHVPLVENTESQNRLEKFAIECLSEEAPLSQGYYFKTEKNVEQFIQTVLLAYYVGNYKRLNHTWAAMDSIEILDLYYTNKIWFNSFNGHELFFIVNSYNASPNYKSKRHETLYRAMNTIISYRKGKRTFLLSLTPDVGPDKDPEHGFATPIFLIKEKIKEVLEAKANRKDPWRCILE